MDLQDTPNILEKMISDQGCAAIEAPLSVLLKTLADFAENTHPEGLADYGGEEDMLMAEWYTPFKASGLEVLLVRQFIVQGGAVLQLQVRRRYAHAPATLRVPGASDWQLESPSFLEATSALSQALAGVAPMSTEVVLDRM